MSEDPTLLDRLSVKLRPKNFRDQNTSVGRQKWFLGYGVVFILVSTTFMYYMISSRLVVLEHIAVPDGAYAYTDLVEKVRDQNGDLEGIYCNCMGAAGMTLEDILNTPRCEAYPTVAADLLAMELGADVLFAMFGNIVDGHMVAYGEQFRGIFSQLGVNKDAYWTFHRDMQYSAAAGHLVESCDSDLSVLKSTLEVCPNVSSSQTAGLCDLRPGTINPGFLGLDDDEFNQLKQRLKQSKQTAPDFVAMVQNMGPEKYMRLEFAKFRMAIIEGTYRLLFQFIGFNSFDSGTNYSSDLSQRARRLIALTSKRDTATAIAKFKEEALDLTEQTQPGAVVIKLAEILSSNALTQSIPSVFSKKVTTKIEALDASELSRQVYQSCRPSTCAFPAKDSLLSTILVNLGTISVINGLCLLLFRVLYVHFSLDGASHPGVELQKRTPAR